MLDVAAASGAEETRAQLLGLVDRLAGADPDRSTALAREQIRATVEAGAAPPGLRRLAEALAAATPDLPPPRRPADDRAPSPEPVPLVEAMRGTALALLDDTDPRVVAAAVDALVADGRRVIVTAADRIALGAVREALDADVHARSLDRIPAVPAADLRELRRLLTAATPARRARADQELPADEVLPRVAEVAELCRRLAAAPAPPADAPPVPPVLAEVLAGLDPARRTTVGRLAGAVTRALAAMPLRDRHPWAWRLLPELVLNRYGGAVEEMLDDATTAVVTLDGCRTLPPVIVTDRVPPDALDTLRRYLEFLDGGGRPRPYFRPPAQREVQPVLSRTSVGSRRPESAEDIRRLIEHLETAARLRRVDLRCAELDLRAPRTELELIGLTGDLAAVTAAVRAVAALRHEVQFLAPDSPVPVPDLDSAVRIARAIQDADDRGGADTPARALDRLADELAGRVAGAAVSPEHARAVAALRERDPAGYTTAVTALSAARREAADEARCRRLLDALSGAAPRLADAWRGGRFGLAAFVPVEGLLAALPPPDSADVVLVHRAAGLGPERLLLAAVAPRLVATAGPGDRSAGGDLLGVLRRIATPVTAAGASGPVRTGRVGA